jgi:hypothetical protein
VFADWRTAPVDEKLRAALGLVNTMTLRPGELGAADIEAVRAAGVSDEAIFDAVYVSFGFNCITRVADSLGFDELDDEGYGRSAKSLLKFGYRFPAPLRRLARSPTW